jgi:hypothetical protein
MATKVDIDLQRLKSEIQTTYASVSQEPEKDFIFPTGRAWAEDLHSPQELSSVPDAAVESFAGVANRSRSDGSHQASTSSILAAAPAPTRSSPPRWSHRRGRWPGST